MAKVSTAAGPGRLEFLNRAFVTGLGAGYLPLAPGTWGSLEGVGIALLVHWLYPEDTRLVLGLVLVVLTVLGVLGAGWFSRLQNDRDPSPVVIDEIAGQLLCLMFVPVSPLPLLLGFFLFRLFDIVKPFPAGRSEGLRGGVGIVLDDLIAGLYAGLLAWLISRAAGL